MKRKPILGLLAMLCLTCGAPLLAADSYVTESARNVPVAAAVDVVVVGGSSGAVAAAAAAAKAGASVFLAAPRPYLGEDLAGTMQVWLEPGESPGGSELARKLFAREGLVARADSLQSLPFSYTADQPADPKHQDKKPVSRLSDGVIGSPISNSVQFNSDVTITADLGKPQKMKDAGMVLFHRARAFSARSVTIATSEDGKTWGPDTVVRCIPSGETISVTAPVGAQARYVRFTVKQMPGAPRVLIAEIILAPDRPAPAAAKKEELVGPIRPLHIKKTLDEALLAAKVHFLYGCYPTDLLCDAQGAPCGIVVANRAGRQAIIAKTIIDASEGAVVARMAGAKFTPFTAGPVTLKRIVIAEKAASAPGVSVRKLDLPLCVFDFKGDQKSYAPASWFEYTTAVDLADESWAARAAMEQKVRDLTWHPTQLYTADRPILVPPVAIQGCTSAKPGEPVERLDLGAFKPAGVERVWVLSGCADIPRASAEKLLRPVAFINAGDRIGQAAAAAAQGLAAPQGIKVSRTAGAASVTGDVKESLAGLRSKEPLAQISQPAGALPVLGRYDVVVVGGGTAGAPAGIAAARAGAKTLMIEYLDGLGGVGTLGMIGKYFRGNKVGFTTTMPENPVEPRMEWYRAELRKAGGDVWFETLGCGALLEGNRVTGVVVATPLGHGVVLAKSVVDATGNCDVAITAGAKHQFVEDFFAVQDSHVSAREVGAYYMNGGLPPTSDADPIDVRAVFLKRGLKKQDAFDWGQIIDSRERRRIVGDFTLDWLDEINQRTFPDSIAWAKTSYDSHGYQIHPFFMLRPPRDPNNIAFEFKAYIPYRCLLPQGVEGMLVTGVGLSVHRDALPIVRMQPDLQNQGYAAGYAAAMAARAGVTPRAIDVKSLQKHLVEIGNLEPHVLSDKDSYPLAVRQIAEAVQAVKKDFTGLEVVMAQSKDSLPLLRQSFAQAEGADKVAYAKVLGVMGDAGGLETLLKEGARLLGSADRDDAPPAISSNVRAADRLSQLVWALGGTRDRRAVPLLSTIAGEIGTNFNRYRAVVVSLMRIGDRAAIPTLVRLLNALPPEPDYAEPREILAVVALYRCGDQDGLARRRLEQYAVGPNGPWAELALQVLKSKPGQGAALE